MSQALEEGSDMNRTFEYQTFIYLHRRAADDVLSEAQYSSLQSLHHIA